jgi:hypothetical protein
MGNHIMANAPVSLVKATDVNADEIAAPALVMLTKRLSLPVGAYSKIGGTARFHVHADGTFEYENSRAERVKINGIQAERQYGKLGFCHLDGFTEPLVRKSRSVEIADETVEEVDPNVARKNPNSEEKVAELRALVGHTVKKK